MGVGQSADLRRLARQQGSSLCPCVRAREEGHLWRWEEKDGIFHIGWLRPSHPLSLPVFLLSSLPTTPKPFKRGIPSFFIKSFKGSAFSRCLIYTGKTPKETKCMEVKKDQLSLGGHYGWGWDGVGKGLGSCRCQLLLDTSAILVVSVEGVLC